MWLFGQGLSGQPFAGPDIGGFAGNATPKLFGRWMGVGALFPFSRGHSDKGSLDHEPWSFGEEVQCKPEKSKRTCCVSKIMQIHILLNYFLFAVRLIISTTKSYWLHCTGEHGIATEFLVVLYFSVCLSFVIIDLKCKLNVMPYILGILSISSYIYMTIICMQSVIPFLLCGVIVAHSPLVSFM
jgi:hypothetical protein